MARKIPPFAAIRAFEAVARLGRNVDAAQELGITASGVSHQIRSLETFVGTALINRSAGQTVELSAEGQQILRPIQKSLDLLDGTFAKYLQRDETPCLKVHMYQSLAYLWVIPKLGSLRQMAPDLKIIITTMPEEVVMSGTDIDMAIVYSTGAPQKNRCIKLFDEVVQPVCSPGFLKERGAITSVEDILSDPIILSQHHKNEWDQWFAATDVSAPLFNTAIEMDSRSNTLKAAASGLGWAMDRRPFGQEMKNAGQLVSPIDVSITSGSSYYLIASQRIDGIRIANTFSNWLQKMCADF